MLEHYFVRPSTIDRLRGSWLGSQIEGYVEWMEAHAYSPRTVFLRVPRLFHFADFAQKRGCRDTASATALVEEFVSHWLGQHGAEAKTSASLRKHSIDVGNAIRQMLRLASDGRVTSNRHRHPFPFESAAPGFAEYLRCERGLKESTIHKYRRQLREFAEYLSKAGINSLGELSPALLASFIVDRAPGMAPCTRRDLCGQLRIFLRFCHREAITNRDLSGAVGMSQVFRLADVPRSITWDEVRRMLEVVDRRTIRGVSPPRLHDLRHSFAVATLLRWYREGVDPNCRLMHLATFPGHVDPNSTAVYLKITEDLLHQAAQCFQALAPKGGDQ
jgi:integrase/recombinase XerD